MKIGIFAEARELKRWSPPEGVDKCVCVHDCHVQLYHALDCQVGTSATILLVQCNQKFLTALTCLFVLIVENSAALIA